MIPQVPEYRNLTETTHLSHYLGAWDQIDLALNHVRSGVAYQAKSARIRGRVRTFLCYSDRAEGQHVRALHERVVAFIQPWIALIPDSVHGYVQGRSILSNARVHAGSLWQQRLDIEEFFPSVSTGHVSNLFLSAGMPTSVAAVIAELVTYDGALPLGLVTSPPVSNLILLETDEELISLASRLGLNYSRYADDLVFSSDSPFDVGSEVGMILAATGFRLHDKKTTISTRGQRQYVTGLSTSEPDGPRLASQFKRRTRQEMYFVETRGIDGHAEALGLDVSYAGERLRGRLCFSHSIEPRWTQRLAERYPGAAESIGFRSSNTARAERDGWLNRTFDAIRGLDAPDMPFFVPAP